jgi:hypothetical protein
MKGRLPTTTEVREVSAFLQREVNYIDRRLPENQAHNIEVAREQLHRRRSLVAVIDWLAVQFNLPRGK